MTDARETRTKNSHEKYLAASRYDTCTRFLLELTCRSFSYEFLARVSWALYVCILVSTVVLVVVSTQWMSGQSLLHCCRSTPVEQSTTLSS